MTKEAGLTGLDRLQVAAAASSEPSLADLPRDGADVLYAIVKLYRSIAIVFAIVWDGSGRGVSISRTDSDCSSRQ